MEQTYLIANHEKEESFKHKIEMLTREIAGKTRMYEDLEENQNILEKKVMEK